MERRLAAIFVVDVVGFSGLMERDEEGTLHRLGNFRRSIFEPIVAAHRGRIVKLTGDGALVEFQSVVNAVDCALEVQSSASQRNAECQPEDRLELRIGVNLGDILIESDDIYGDGVNLAARLEQIAPVGGLCISDTAYEHIQGKISEPFSDLGEQKIKNITRPIRVWRWPCLDQVNDGAGPPGGTGGEPESLAQEPTESGQASLAVLPLVSMSERADLEFLADGLTEDIITLLSRLPGFLVIARNSSFMYKGKSPDIRDVGRQLNVRYVVEGSLRPVADKIRVTVQLIEAESGNHLWAERFDQPAEEIEALQDEITLSIAARLEPELAKAEIERIRRRGSDNMDAWAYYNQANGLLMLKGWHRDTFAESAELLHRAIELDPEFALAHAYLSLILALSHMFGLPPEEDVESHAVAAADLAMEIDGRDPSVLGFAGCALCDLGLLDRGLEILERAVASDPSNAQAWIAMGTAFLRRGKARKGIELLRHGMRISPIDNRLAYWATNLAYALFRLHEYEEAEEQARTACWRDDKNYMGRVVLALILTHLGRVDEAERVIKEALRIRPGLTAEDVRPLIGRRGGQILSKAGILS